MGGLTLRLENKRFMAGLDNAYLEKVLSGLASESDRPEGRSVCLPRFENLYPYRSSLKGLPG